MPPIICPRTPLSRRPFLRTVTRRAGGSDGALAWIASEGRTTGTLKGKAVDRVTTETMLLRRIGQ